MEKDEEINLLRRLFDGEEIEESLLGEIEENIYTKRGFNVFVSDNIDDIKLVYVNPYLYRLLEEREEELTNLQITRFDNPQIFLKNMIVVEDSSLPSYDYLKLHKKDIKSLYSNVDVENKTLNFRAKLVLGKNNKVFKDLLPRSSYMSKYEVRLLRDLDDVEVFLLSEYYDPVIEYLQNPSIETKRMIVKKAEEAGEIVGSAIRFKEVGYEPLTKEEKLRELAENLICLCGVIRREPLDDLETIKGYNIGRDEIVLPYLYKYLNFDAYDVFITPRGASIGIGTMRVKRYENIKPYTIGISNEHLENLEIKDKRGIPADIVAVDLPLDSRRITIKEEKVTSPAKKVSKRKEAQVERKTKTTTQRQKRKVTRRTKVSKAKEKISLGNFKFEGEFSGTFKGLASPN